MSNIQNIQNEILNELKKRRQPKELNLLHTLIKTYDFEPSLLICNKWHTIKDINNEINFIKHVIEIEQHIKTMKYLIKNKLPINKEDKQEWKHVKHLYNRYAICRAIRLCYI